MIWAAINGRFPVIEYLVERGADIQAKNNVSDVIISYETTHTSHMNISVNVSEWIHTVAKCCNGRSFSSG